jgi:hypothetical protein
MNNARIYIDAKVKQLAPSRKMVISSEMLSDAFADEAEAAAYFMSAGCYYVPASLSGDGLARVMRKMELAQTH